jgi:Na+/melibiose symporter-like transporter
VTAVFRAPGFARLWTASFFAESAEWIALVALPLYVFGLTGSAASLAAGLVVGTVPTVLLSPVAGVCADRFDRRLVLGVVCVGQAAVVLPLYWVHSGGQIWLVYAVLAAQAALTAFFDPARNAFLPEIVGVGQVTAANGLMGVNSSVTRLAGSALGGVLLGFGGLAQVVWAYQAALLVAGALLLRRFPVLVTVRAVAAKESILKSWLDGLGEIRRDHRLRVTTWSMVLMALAQGTFAVLFVPFVTDVLGGSEAEVGVLRGVQAIGGLAAGAALSTVARRVSPARLFGWGSIAFGVVAGILWNTAYLTTAFSAYLGLFIVIGAPLVVVNAGLLSIVQSSSSPERAGRVLSTVFATFTAFTAVGSLAAGALAGRVPLPVLLSAQAVLVFAAGAFALRELVFRRKQPESAAILG